VSGVPVTLLRPDLPPRWPAVVRGELERRQQVLAGLARGRVLDVGSPSGRDLLVRTVRAAGGPIDDGPDAAGAYDTVVSVAGLVRFPDLVAALRGVERLLAPEGVLLLAEPVGRPGPVGLVVASAGSLLPPVRGAHLARDVPAAVRAAGFLMTDLERITMPTAVWPLRHLVQARALRWSELAP
jgi:hypothetical protein